MSKQPLLDTIYVSARGDFFGDGSKPNKSIARLTNVKKSQDCGWQGPVVAYGMVGLGIDQTTYRDLNMTDFRHVADFFLSHMSKSRPLLLSELPPSTGEMIWGVRINCKGDQTLKKPQFQVVEQMPPNIVFPFKHDTSEIAERIDLPVLTLRYAPDPKWAPGLGNTTSNSRPFVDQEATFLHLCCNADAVWDPLEGNGSWGFALMHWQDKVGSILVLRQDMKPLLPLHVEALCNYCQHEISPMIHHFSEEEEYSDNPMSRQDFQAMINRSSFEYYWHKFLED